MAKFELLTIDELAAELKVKPSWIYRRTGMGGDMPVLRLGRYLRFDRQAVLEWVKAEYNADFWMPGYHPLDDGEEEGE